MLTESGQDILDERRPTQSPTARLDLSWIQPAISSAALAIHFQAAGLGWTADDPAVSLQQHGLDLISEVEGRHKAHR